jgi:hypothetical protein
MTCQFVDLVGLLLTVRGIGPGRHLPSATRAATANGSSVNLPATGGSRSTALIQSFSIGVGALLVFLICCAPGDTDGADRLRLANDRKTPGPAMTGRRRRQRATPIGDPKRQFYRLPRLGSTGDLCASCEEEPSIAQRAPRHTAAYRRRLCSESDSLSHHD